MRPMTPGKTELKSVIKKKIKAPLPQSKRARKAPGVALGLRAGGKIVV
jgi:hypothetical protein